MILRSNTYTTAIAILSVPDPSTFNSCRSHGSDCSGSRRAKDIRISRLKMDRSAASDGSPVSSRDIAQPHPAYGKRLQSFQSYLSTTGNIPITIPAMSPHRGTLMHRPTCNLASHPASHIHSNHPTTKQAIREFIGVQSCWLVFLFPELLDPCSLPSGSYG
jgi:hypothetical protein